MSVQPFQSNQKIVIEKRDEHGKLDLSDPQPPVKSCTFDALYRMFFNANPDPNIVGTWENLKAWLDEKGWTIRAKTW
jgi:hypothetical protein